MEDERHHPSERSGRHALDLPVEIVFEIFLLLPARAILNLRSVCKAWNSYSRDPHFISTHTQRSVNSDNYLIMCKDSPHCSLLFYNPRLGDTTNLPLHDPRPPPLQDDENLPKGPKYIIPSINGLILLVYAPQHIQVCNPCTKETLTLPAIDKDFDIRPNRYWFAIDPSTGKYKVILLPSVPVRLSSSLPKSSSSSLVFTQGTHNWTSLQDWPQLQLEYGPIQFKGHIYCFTIDIKERDGPLLSFDLVTHKFAIIETPFSGYMTAMSGPSRVLQVLEGSLCIFDPQWRRTNIWMLKEKPNHCWVKAYNMKDIHMPLLSLVHHSTVLKVIAIHGGKLIFYLQDGPLGFWVRGDKINLYSYDFESKTVEKLPPTSPHHSQCFSAFGTIYFETVALTA